MPMLPQVSIEDGESLVSWAARSAWAQTGLELSSLLSFAGLSHKAVLAPADDDLDRLCELFGGNRTQIAQAAVTPTGVKMSQFRSEVFRADFLSWRNCVVCPVCIGEDAQPFGRVLWHLESAKICAKHQILLVRRALAQPDDILFISPEQLYTGQDELDCSNGNICPNAISPMQRYVEHRIHAGIGPAWMDGQRLDQVVRTAKVLGVAWLYGHQAKPQNLTSAQLLAAENAGYDIVAAGEQGITSCLNDILLAARRSNNRATPQASLGIINSWAEGTEDAGPIRLLLRDFILENFPIAAGTTVLGTAVPKRLRHCVSTLASELAISSMPLEGALINEGLLPFENDPPRRCIAFDSAAGEVVARKVKASISLEGVGDYLGCEPVVARTVATEGFAERAFSEHFNMVGRAPKVLHRLTTVSLDDFLSALFSRAKSVDAFHPNVLPLVRAAKSENWPVGSVIKLVLAKKLAVYRLLNRQDFGSLLIDPSDLHRILHAPPSSAHISKRDAARQLGVEQMTISRLVNTSDENGRPFLRRVLISLNRNQKQQNVCRDDLDAFNKTHISLGKHAKDKAMGVGELFTQLKSCEIHPFPFATTKNDQFYRRSGL
jgi:hypothetical protein